MRCLFFEFSACHAEKFASGTGVFALKKTFSTCVSFARNFFFKKITVSDQSSPSHLNVEARLLNMVWLATLGRVNVCVLCEEHDSVSLYNMITLIKDQMPAPSYPQFIFYFLTDNFQ